VSALGRHIFVRFRPSAVAFCHSPRQELIPASSEHHHHRHQQQQQQQQLELGMTELFDSGHVYKSVRRRSPIYQLTADVTRQSSDVFTTSASVATEHVDTLAYPPISLVTTQVVSVHRLALLLSSDRFFDPPDTGPWTETRGPIYTSGQIVRSGDI